MVMKIRILIPIVLLLLALPIVFSGRTTVNSIFIIQNNGTGGGGNINASYSPFTDVDNIYIWNDSGTITFNESKLNDTIDLRDETGMINHTDINQSRGFFDFLTIYNLLTCTDCILPSALHLMYFKLSDFTDDIGFQHQEGAWNGLNFSEAIGGYTNITYDDELQNETIIRSHNTSWVTDSIDLSSYLQNGSDVNFTKVFLPKVSIESETKNIEFVGYNKTLRIDLGDDWKWGVTWSLIDHNGAGSIIRWDNSFMMNTDNPFLMDDNSDNGFETSSNDGGNESFYIFTEIGGLEKTGYIIMADRLQMDNVNREPTDSVDDVTFRIYSNDVTNPDDYIQFYHDQQDGRIDVGNGALIINATELCIMDGSCISSWDDVTYYNDRLNSTINASIDLRVDTLFLQNLLDSVYPTIALTQAWINSNSTADRAYTDVRVDSIDNHTATVDSNASTACTTEEALIGDGTCQRVYNQSTVDDLVSSIAFDFFFTNDTSDLNGMYNLSEIDFGRPENFLQSGLITTGTNSIFNFSTIQGEPEFNELRRGIYDVHVHIFVTSGGKKDVTITPKLYNISVDGNNRDLLITFESVPITTSGTPYNLHGILTEDIMLGNDTRIMIEFVAEVSGGGGDPTVQIDMEGTTDSHFTLQTSSQAFEKIFLRLDGLNSPTNDIDWGGFSIFNLANYFTKTEIIALDYINSSKFQNETILRKDTNIQVLKINGTEINATVGYFTNITFMGMKSYKTSGSCEPVLCDTMCRNGSGYLYGNLTPC